MLLADGTELTSAIVISSSTVDLFVLSGQMTSIFGCLLYIQVSFGTEGQKKLKNLQLSPECLGAMLTHVRTLISKSACPNGPQAVDQYARVKP